MRILFCVSIGDVLAGIDLGELVLLGSDLNPEALAQIAGADARGIEMLDEVDAPANGSSARAVSGDASCAAAVPSAETAASPETAASAETARWRRQVRRRRQLCPRRQFRL